MSQLNPQEPFVIRELAGHRYKVRTKYNYMFFLYYQRTLIKNIKEAVLEAIRPSLEEQDVSSEAISMESVAEWSKSHTESDPIYFESFFETCCVPLDDAPPIKDVLLDIEPEALEELTGFFGLLRDGESVTAKEGKSSIKVSPKRGKAVKPNSKTRTRPRTTRPSNIEA